MLFSELINQLKKRPGNLIEYDIKNNPEISNGESLERANQNEISFLEKHSPFSKYLFKEQSAWLTF